MFQLTSEIHSPAPAVNIESRLKEISSGFEYHDRYEFSSGDSELWIRLFMYADQINPDLATMLEYIRNTGAVLTPSDKYGYRIEPIIGPRGWSSVEEYEQERQPLIKWGAEIIKILRRLKT